MSSRRYFRPTDWFCIQVAGSDAITVINNLCTNDVQQLQDGVQCEAFITNLKGWVVAHVLVFKEGERLWLIGQHPEPEAVVQHIDRYIIREDASVELAAPSIWILESEPGEEWEHTEGDRICSLPFVGDPSVLLSPVLPEAIIERLEKAGLTAGADQDWSTWRIRSFWPRHDCEIGDKCLPQELDRDSTAISFTKGCYLGQETVARLDARGQLQKKLCLLEISAKNGARVEQGPVESVGGRKLGELTSVSKLGSDDRYIALGYLVRGFYEVGSSMETNAWAGTVTQSAAHQLD